MLASVTRFTLRFAAAVMLGGSLISMTAVMANAAEPATALRSRQLFDFDWRFVESNTEGAEAPGFDDAAWQTLDLPHDFTIDGPYRKDSPTRTHGAFLPGGVGWYRKTFTLPSDARDRKAFVEFDGAYHHSDVWINGQHLGFRPYGYVGFEYEMTPHLNFDGPNVLAVRVDNSDGLNCRWYAGSGINRHVWLTLTDPLRIDHWGVAVSTPEISSRRATARVRVNVVNGQAAARSCTLNVEILDSEGKTVGGASVNQSIGGGATHEFDQQIRIERPALWSPETPVLYTARLSVADGGRAVDNMDVPFGIRSIRWDAKKGFLLNDKVLKLKGVCSHHDLGPLGAAFNDRALERRLQILKSMGCNAIRTSHNPHAPQLLDLCDRLGFVVVDEAFDKWDGRFYAGRASFDEWWQRDLDAMLLRDRNHPSVVLWSVGNELQSQGNERFYEILKMLADHVRKTDPTRPVSIGLKPVNGPSIEEAIQTVLKTGEIVDVVGLNYMEELVDAIHKANPRIPLYSSESYLFFRGRKLDYHAFVPSNPWFDVVNKDYFAGQFTWAGIEYLGESPGWPVIAWPDADVDLCGFFKPQAYWRQSVWTEKPMVHIAVEDPGADMFQGKEIWSWPKLVDHWTLPRFENSVIRLYAFSNCDTVELFINDKSKGVKSPADFPNRIVEWWAPYQPGTIRAVGRIGEMEAAEHILKTAGAPAEIELTADRPTIDADGQDVAHVTARILDADGNHVPEARVPLDFQLEGPGWLAAVGSGDLADHTPFTQPRRTTYHGQALAIVRSARHGGTLRLTASSKDLPPVTVEIMAKAAE